MKKKVLVTGANGFIGAHLCKRLAIEGHEVAVLLRPKANPVRLDLLQVNRQTYCAELGDGTDLTSVFRQFAPDWVFHLASHGVRSSHAVDETTLRVNVQGTSEILKASANSGAERVVLMGSGFEYAPTQVRSTESAPLKPFTFYGATKAAAWQLAQYYSGLNGCEVVLARLFTAYGAMEHRSRIFPHIMIKALGGHEIPLTSGTQVRDYLHVDDVVEALLVIAQSPGLNGEVVNVCSSEPVNIKRIAHTIVERAGVSADLLRFGEVPERTTEPAMLVGDNTRLQDLGWKREVGLEEGVSQTLSWYRDAESIRGHLP